MNSAINLWNLWELSEIYASDSLFLSFLIRFSLLYFFLRDALAVDGAPGEDDVG